MLEALAREEDLSGVLSHDALDGKEEERDRQLDRLMERSDRDGSADPPDADDGRDR